VPNLHKLIGVLASRPDIVQDYLINIDIGGNVGQTSTRVMSMF
jgi:hypothetical protein